MAAAAKSSIGIDIRRASNRGRTHRRFRRRSTFEPHFDTPLWHYAMAQAYGSDVNEGETGESTGGVLSISCCVFDFYANGVVSSSPPLWQPRVARNAALVALLTVFRRVIKMTIRGTMDWSKYEVSIDMADLNSISRRL